MGISNMYRARTSTRGVPEREYRKRTCNLAYFVNMTNGVMTLSVESMGSLSRTEIEHRGT